MSSPVARAPKIALEHARLSYEGKGSMWYGVSGEAQLSGLGRAGGGCLVVMPRTEVTRS